MTETFKSKAADIFSRNCCCIPISRTRKESSVQSWDTSDVIELTDATFDDLLIKSNEPWLVDFYVTWCGWCQQLAPEWKKAATDLKGIIKMGAIDCDANPKSKHKYRVAGYPTIYFWPEGKKGEPEDYGGGRTEETIVEWVKHKLGPH